MICHSKTKHAKSDLRRDIGHLVLIQCSKFAIVLKTDDSAHSAHFALVLVFSARTKYPGLVRRVHDLPFVRSELRQRKIVGPSRAAP